MATTTWDPNDSGVEMNDLDEDPAVGEEDSDGEDESLPGDIDDVDYIHARPYSDWARCQCFYPMDERDKERLDRQHRLVSELRGGLHLSPRIESTDGKPARVLDIGTGSGAWAIECAERYENEVDKVIGVDLRPIQPDIVPENCYFEIYDCEWEWNWKHPFDFVRIALTAGCIKDRKRLFKQAFEFLRPGGFLEVVDFHDTPQCEDDTYPKDDPARALFQFNRAAAAKLERPVDDVKRYGVLMEDVGFVDVKEDKRYAPTNPWPRDPTGQRLGGLTIEVISGHTEALYLCRLVRAGHDCNEAAVYCAKTRQTLRDPNKHLEFVLQTFWGQKPFSEGTAA